MSITHVSVYKLSLLNRKDEDELKRQSTTYVIRNFNVCIIDVRRHTGLLAYKVIRNNQSNDIFRGLIFS